MYRAALIKVNKYILKNCVIISGLAYNNNNRLKKMVSHMNSRSFSQINIFCVSRDTFRLEQLENQR